MDASCRFYVYIMWKVTPPPGTAVALIWALIRYWASLLSNVEMVQEERQNENDGIREWNSCWIELISLRFSAVKDDEWIDERNDW